jgi:hypothetical protein
MLLALLLCLCAVSADLLGYMDHTSRLHHHNDTRAHAVLALAHRCDLLRSSLTRMAADASFFNPVKQLWSDHSVPSEPVFPSSCPLLAHHDAYHDYHDKRFEFNHHGIRCCYCGKSFDSQGNLDKHLLRRHSAQLNLSAPGCLSDYCDVLQCHSIDPHFQQHYSALPCFPRKMDILQSQCRSVLTGCLPHQPVQYDGNTTLLQDDLQTLVDTICDTLTCEHIESLRRWAWVSWRSVLRVVAALAVLAATALFLGYLAACVSELRRTWKARATRATPPAMFNRLPSFQEASFILCLSVTDDVQGWGVRIRRLLQGRRIKAY